MQRYAVSSEQSVPGYPERTFGPAIIVRSKPQRIECLIIGIAKYRRYSLSRLLTHLMAGAGIYRRNKTHRVAGMKKGEVCQNLSCIYGLVDIVAGIPITVTVAIKQLSVFLYPVLCGVERNPDFSVISGGQHLYRRCPGIAAVGERPLRSRHRLEIRTCRHMQDALLSPAGHESRKITHQNK